MLDATLRKAGKFSGVLCVEHVGGQRLWNEHEKRYVVSIADLVMRRLVYEDTRRNEACYIDALKIDRVFVRDMLNNEQDAIIVRSIIALAHNLKLQVVAEGVEDADSLRNLRDMHCDQAQGYYFARPAPSEEMTQWLVGRKPADSV